MRLQNLRNFKFLICIFFILVLTSCQSAPSSISITESCSREIIGTYTTQLSTENAVVGVTLSIFSEMYGFNFVEEMFYATKIGDSWRVSFDPRSNTYPLLRDNVLYLYSTENDVQRDILIQTWRGENTGFSVPSLPHLLLFVFDADDKKYTILSVNPDNCG